MENKIKKVLLIFIYAFFLNWIWENLHSYLYFLPSGEPITQSMLLKSTLYDALFITFLGILFVKVSYFRKRKWYALIFGFIAAIIIEKNALGDGRWAYNSLMPMIPLLKTGLTPTIQLSLLSFIILKLVDSKRIFQIKHKILFACDENTGRSQMAEAFFNHYAKEKGLDWIAESAGTIPAKQVNPLIIEVMAEKNLGLKGAKPKLFLPEKINDYERIISFGCLVKSFFSPEVQERIEEWHINDPNQKSKDEVRKIRNEIENRIINLMRAL